MNVEKNKELINLIAKEVSSLIPDCCGVTLGGSRSHAFEDEHSDVEMYFYSHKGAPSEEKLTECLMRLNAEHKRHPSFLWNNKKPWGPHSFFVIDGLYFEIGYRNIDEIKDRIITYVNGNVAPQSDCHDLGLGYMPSGLAASVAAEKPLILCDEELNELKSLAESFPSDLIKDLKKEFFDTAKNLLNGKLLTAAKRCDVFFYEVISNRITRCLMIMAFALSSQHFPGDKWNEEMLLQTKWQESKKFIDLLKKHIMFKAVTEKEFLEKRNILLEAFNLIEKELEKC